ncbi:acyl-coa dehydrogenase [hydrocarbon metagenome]|uniref:Acyl-coa dehydrogenase n=1 Tax=hydrocarbon metagenome TaxID=938273 RepID=A0A0W8E9C2_9ZZZZ
MPHYNWLYQMRDIKFQIKEWLDMKTLLSLDAYKEYYAIDDIDNFLDVNFKVCRDVMCPANKDADDPGATYVGGEEHAVVTPDSFKTVYKTIMDAELGPQFGFRGEGKIPLSWYAPILEMQSAASPSIVMFWCLTQGATTVLQDYGTQKQQDMFLPKMYTGEWCGTMGLTEPGAGSEVGAVQSKAFPTDTPHLYKLKGTKCFITSGDHDLAENIIHLMLAKTPGAKEGTAGISLFIVPKFWVNDDGSLGKWNDVTSVGIEHKMGIHGSSTLTLAMGENDNCYGWMVGEKEVVDGKGVGMSQMFAYMNEERLNTGLFALGCIGSAYYAALDYTKVRVQSKHSTNPKGPSVRIIEHEDVRRMLLLQKSILEATRALIFQSYLYVDLSKDAPTPEEREYYHDMFMINNPLCKAYTSDMARISTGEAIQCHGGYGFMEEYAGAELYRDVVIYGIWEGTNFIQAQDYTGRKFTMKGGEPFRKWVAEIDDFISGQKTEEFAAEFEMMADCMVAFKDIVDMNAAWTAGDKQMKQLFTTRTMHAGARVYCGKLMLDQALLAARKLAELGEDHFDANFYKGKIATAKFYIMNHVPEIFGYHKAMKAGNRSAIDIAEEQFM